MARDTFHLKKAWSRAVVLRYFPLIAILLLDVIFLLMLDSLFSNKKRALILDSQNKFISMFKPIDPLRETIHRLYDNYEGIERQHQSGNNEEAIAKEFEIYKKLATEYLSKNAPVIIDGPHPWFWLILTDKNDRLIYEYKNPDKLKRYNDWTNCLFSRSFYAPVGTPNTHLTVYYATPKGWPEIEAMVLRYWIYAIIFMIGSAVIHIFLSRYVFHPLQRIGQAIESTIGSSQVAMIDSATRDIERAYNQLARNQREISFGLEVDRIVDDLHSLADEQQVLELYLQKLVSGVSKIYPIENIQAVRHTPDGWVPLPTEAGRQSMDVPSETVSLQDRRFQMVLHSDEQPVGLLLCTYYKEQTEEEVRWMIQEIQRQAENGLSRSLARSRALTQERNRFGINLATNMGHDLTNIIASGKWDLDTIQRAQNLGIVRLNEDNGSFFTQAVEGLRNNLQFLQEMVDIYRSVAYIQRPRFEDVDVSHLVRQVAELFRRSTSQHLSIDVEGVPSLTMHAEPRLLRMAFFNLFANAYQAILRSPERNVQGRIEVWMEIVHGNRLMIHVSDNGPGIRDAEGNLLPEPDIGRIFHSGYSTKRQNSGGGLGLSWVKSIVEEFHHGTLRATNRLEGGASLILTLPLIVSEPKANSSDSSHTESQFL